MKRKVAEIGCAELPPRHQGIQLSAIRRNSRAQSKTQRGVGVGCNADPLAVDRKCGILNRGRWNPPVADRYQSAFASVSGRAPVR